MKHNVSLTIASLLSIVLMTIHQADDVVRGMSPGGVVNMVGVLIFVVWLYGTVALAERRAGYAIMLLGGLFGAAVPVIHMRGAGLGAAIAKSDGGFFFVWTLIALGVTGVFSALVAARGLWEARVRLAR
ncbi:MAG: hypothetical protein HY944_04500 [Gemmatimonadetes bacterium]|nr:hypothetical protein [Gemmatimonadota bacterium]